MPTDEEILKAMAQPETLEKGFRMLVQVYQERLYWHIRRLVLSHQNADDVLQNTLVKVFRGIGNFKGDSQLYTWLYRIATNESLTFLEKEKKTRTGGRCGRPYHSNSPTVIGGRIF